MKIVNILWKVFIITLAIPAGIVGALWCLNKAGFMMGASLFRDSM